MFLRSGRDAILLPIPNKGDLTRCDNWWGISLLDTMGKLQRVVEDDSQCRFRSGRGCVDMIFCARQLMENNPKMYMYMLFVDLCKAYDSISHQALWLVLRKYGIHVPPVLIQSLREGMKAEVTVDGSTTPAIDVNSSLRQGCTIAPSLFSLYFNLVMEDWRKRCLQLFGVEVLYRCSGKLVGKG